MTHNEVIDILEQIDAIYPNKFIKSNQDATPTIKQWVKLLAPYPLEQIEQNLIAHVEESPFPPTIADLVKRTPTARPIPTAEETMAFTGKYDNRGNANPETAAQAQAEIRKILGMRGDSYGRTIQQRR